MPIPFYDLKKAESIQVETPIGSIAVCRRALETDYLINLPVLKGHCQTVMTCALKNCKGAYRIMRRGDFMHWGCIVR